jgi:hypothetical protein
MTLLEQVAGFPCIETRALIGRLTGAFSSEFRYSQTVLPLIGVVHPRESGDGTGAERRPCTRQAVGLVRIGRGCFW